MCCCGMVGESKAPECYKNVHPKSKFCSTFRLHYFSNPAFYYQPLKHQNRLSLCRIPTILCWISSPDNPDLNHSSVESIYLSLSARGPRQSGVLGRISLLFYFAHLVCFCLDGIHFSNKMRCAVHIYKALRHYMGPCGTVPSAVQMFCSGVDLKGKRASGH